MRTRAEQLAAIQADQQLWRDLAAEVGPDRYGEPGPMGEWSFGDMAGHLLGWRNRTIVTPALLAELQTGRIRAALDVTDPEPLPPDPPLWGLPNVLLTPHMAGDSPASTIRAFELAGDQIRRFAAGEPLINEVARYLLE
jgi:hypothetical protein